MHRAIVQSSHKVARKSIYLKPYLHESPCLYKLATSISFGIALRASQACSPYKPGEQYMVSHPRWPTEITEVLMGSCPWPLRLGIQVAAYVLARRIGLWLEQNQS